MMTRLLISFLALLLLLPSLPSHASGNDFPGRPVIDANRRPFLPAPLLSSLQRQFQGRIVGIRPQSQNQMEVQVLTANNRLIVVTVDASSGAVLHVQE